MAEPTDSQPFPLSVLDLAPVGRGSTPADALRNSIELVQEVERLGYRRHWVAEHHNMPGIASSSPPVLLAHLASVTSTIRARLRRRDAAQPRRPGGRGAVRDAGGAAPRPDRPRHRPRPGHRPADRRPRCAGARVLLGADDFPEQLTELLGYFSGSLPDGHPYEHITAVPARGYRPAIWMLGLEHLRRAGGGRARHAVLVRLPLRAGDGRRRAHGVPPHVPAVTRARAAVRDARGVGGVR